MAVNTRDNVRRAIRLFDQPWFRERLAARNGDGERVLITADRDTPLREVMEALDREGGSGNLVLLDDAAVTTIVIVTTTGETVDAPHAELDGATTVAAFLDACRAMANAEDATFTYVHEGHRRGLCATGLQRESVAA